MPGVLPVPDARSNARPTGRAQTKGNRMFNRTNSRKLASTAIAAAAFVGVLAMTAGSAQAVDSTTTAPVQATGQASHGAKVADEALWFIKARHSGLPIIYSVVQDRMVQRNMTGLNPLYTGQLSYFHYNSSAHAYVVESFNGGCLDIKDGISRADGADLSLNQCDGTTSQLWYSDWDGAAWDLTSVWSGLNATVDGSGNNAPVRQHPDHGAANQRFDMPMFVG